MQNKKIPHLRLMITIFKNATVYDPAPAGKKDILTGGSSILAVGEHIDPPGGTEVETIDCEGLWLVPGLIDGHVHLTGGGGEGGPASRMPELQVEMMIDGGVTTVVGCLGTDGITRSVESLLMKVKMLRAQGVSAWMYTGSYQVPPPTITGDLARDIALFEEIIGVGELAISDHRSSIPSFQELARITAHTRVAGMIGGKAGIVHVHMGDGMDPFRPIHEVVEGTMMGYKQFLPAHCNRNHHIFRETLEYGKKGYVDITTSSYPYDPEGEVKSSKALKQLLDAGVPAGHIVFSSDACGSLPIFDAEGNLVRIDMGLPSSILQEIRDAVQEEGIPLETALKVATSNPAGILKLKGKGYIRPGYDADILVLDRDFRVRYLVAMGKVVRR